MADWVGRNGSADQRERHAAGLLPVEEVIDAMTDEAFATVDDVPRYQFDGASRLRAASARWSPDSRIAVSAATSR